MPSPHRFTDRLVPDRDCGDVASPWPGTIIEVKPHDGVLIGAEGVVTVVAGGRLVRFIVRKDQVPDA